MKVRNLLQCVLLSVLMTCTLNLQAASQKEARLSLHLSGAPLSEAMDSIRNQSRFLFINNGVDVSVKVSLSVSDATIDRICDALFTPVRVNYVIEGYSIIISEIPQAEPVSISGSVIDASGYPVPGAAVLEQGTSNGTVTDLDGRFSLTLTDPGSVIEVNCLGYETTTMSVDGRSVFEITLKEESVALEGTVITALGIRRDEKALSYNVQQVESDAITAVRDANFINALSGKSVAGARRNSAPKVRLNPLPT